MHRKVIQEAQPVVPVNQMTSQQALVVEANLLNNQQTQAANHQALVKVSQSALAAEVSQALTAIVKASQALTAIVKASPKALRVKIKGKYIPNNQAHQVQISKRHKKI